ncbi:glycosyltransferase [Roseovarius sp. S4756]|uniref:glycosyltransferase n=1 Tax=Roseovarius maritimus TaxID=3342637 RepID=UPI00372963D1
MGAALPPGIAKIVVTEGQIFLNALEQVIEAGPMLALNGHRAEFEPLSDTVIDSLDFLSEYRPDFDHGALVADTGPDTATGAECHVNALPDWALANRKTVQIKITDKDHRQVLALRAPVQVPPQKDYDGRPLAFRAGLAAHRAHGQLQIEITDTASGQVKTHRFDFSNTHRGGISSGGYLQIEQALPPYEAGATLRLSVTYAGFIPEPHDVEPYLFVADPHVGPQGKSGAAVNGLVLNGDANLSGTCWTQARLPQPVEAGETLKLLCDGSETSILTGTDAKVTLTEDQGHTLIFETDQAQECQFHIDGAQAFGAALGVGATAVHVPARYKTGRCHQLSIWNATATQILGREAVLLPRVLTPVEVLQSETTRPFSGALMAQADHRYEALKAQLARGLDARGQAQIAHALSTLEGGIANAGLEPLEFPQMDGCDASIIIPAHNKIHVTYLALCSLLLADNRASFEVIVVDDASEDPTSELESIVSGITVIHHVTPQRFIRACNNGVKAARGKYVVLLNNDVEVTSGWLDALIDGFERFDNVGLVGSKLLYPDGSLQDAGGIVWGNGNPWNYGNRQNPWEPRFSYARQADYLSGAALMTTKAIWDEVGGLSRDLEPMYFEDTDLAFKIRDAGYGTWFIPSSIVYHYEGMTSGTDVTSGFKQHQEINRPKFKRKWARAFAGYGIEGVDPDLEKDRGIIGRVLFIDYETPRPDRDAGSYAAIQEMKMVQSLGYKVTFISQNLAYLGSYTHALERMGVEVIYAPFCLSMQDYLANHAAEFDAVYITRYYVGADVIDLLRQIAPRAKILFNNADLHFLRELRAGLAAKDAARIDTARVIRDAEVAVMAKADLVLSYNDSEHPVILSHTDGKVRVMKCPWVVGLPHEVPGLEARAGLSFLGSYRHHPNAEGVTWFVQNVMPLLEHDHPDLVLSIYGSGMGEDIRALASDTVRPVGFIPDTAAAFDPHRIFLAPLLSGAGIKGKVLSALAHGIPCILSPVAAEGIGLRHGHDCFIAETAREWADAIAALQDDDALWQRVSDNARAYVGEAYSFANGRAQMRRAFEAVDLYSPAP